MMRGVRSRAQGTLVSGRGQIAIGRDIRTKLGIQPSDIAIQHVEDGRLIVEFVRPHEPHLRSLAGILGPPPARPQGPLDIDDAVARGIAEEWDESLSGPTP